jgi:hypothetical protein
MQVISWLAENRLASQERFSSMTEVSPKDTTEQRPVYLMTKTDTLCSKNQRRRTMTKYRNIHGYSSSYLNYWIYISMSSKQHDT